MCKINNFELKNIVNYKGHEGEPLIQGDLYYNGKKIGWYNQNANGGEDTCELDYDIDKELKGELQKKLDNYEYQYKNCEMLKDKIYKGGEYLCEELYKLSQAEKDYKKGMNANNDIMLYIFEDENRYKILRTKNIYELDKETLYKTFREQFGNKYMELYTSMKDFDIQKEGV